MTTIFLMTNGVIIGSEYSDSQIVALPSHET